MNMSLKKTSERILVNEVDLILVFPELMCPCYIYTYLGCRKFFHPSPEYIDHLSFDIYHC